MVFAGDGIDIGVDWLKVLMIEVMKINYWRLGPTKETRYALSLASLASSTYYLDQVVTPFIALVTVLHVLQQGWHGEHPL